MTSDFGVSSLSILTNYWHTHAPAWVRQPDALRPQQHRPVQKGTRERPQKRAHAERWAQELNTLVPTLRRGHANRTLRVHSSTDPSFRKGRGSVQGMCPRGAMGTRTEHTRTHAPAWARQPDAPRPQQHRPVQKGTREHPQKRAHAERWAQELNTLVPTLPRGHANRTLRVHSSTDPSTGNGRGSVHRNVPTRSDGHKN